MPVLAGSHQRGGTLLVGLIDGRPRLDQDAGNLLVIETSVTDVTDMDILLKTTAYI